ncbi:hypothetical protein [Roseibium album]|uniref:hypothetical protein n=1 Tax=Roseibium album TaxID=311410 RepID=UPI003297AB61
MNDPKSYHEIVKRLISAFTYFLSLLSKIPDSIRSVLVPTALTVLGVIILSLKGTDHGVIFWSCILLFGIFATVKALVDYINLTSWKEVERENELHETALSWKNYAVDQKIRSLSDVAISSSSLQQKTRRVRSILKFENTSRIWCMGLKETVINFLSAGRSLREAEVRVAILVPNEEDFFRVVFSTSKNIPNVNQETYDTGFSTKKEDTLAGWLWNNSASHVSYSDVRKAIAKENFKYLYPEQEMILRSIFCCKVFDGRTKKPHAIISIDSDEYGVLPDSNTKKAKKLERIVSHFATRLSLELVYDGLLEELGPFLEEKLIKDPKDASN